MIEKLMTSNLKLGIIAGGQLGKMLIQEASKWDIITYVLDNDENCPASKIATYYVKGSHLDYEAVYNFGKLVDVLTYEIENINIQALKKLKSEGFIIVPDPDILELIQDKGLQKEFYLKNNIPTPFFRIYKSKDDIINGIEKKEISFPFIQKIRKGGYDGRGVVVVNSKNDLKYLLNGESVIEEKIEIDREIAVIAARNKNNEIKCFPVVEMIFNDKANLVEKIFFPSSIKPEQSEEAINIASKLIQLLQIEGLLAVEFFVDVKGSVLVNEIAPRPHNSGHLTIEGAITSQFEQHIRAILNLPLGSTEMKMPSVMINILGMEEHEGPVVYENLEKCLAIEGAKIHLYGKKITKPYRKMGHITILSNTLENAFEKAEKIKKLLKVKSWKKN